MKRLCPTMSELLAFEAAARLGSFTLAAGELGVTQGAVSKAISSLEGFVRTDLFVRSGSRISLTPAGRTYLTGIAPHLLALQAETAALMTDRGAGGRVTLAAMPSFAERWILPRLGGFYAANPNVRVSFAPYTRAGDFAGGIDCAIRFGAGEWPNAEGTYLAGRQLVAVVGQALKRSLRSPEEVARLPLLHHYHFQDQWPRWLSAHGVDPSLGTAGSTFDQYGLLIKAAVAGLGCGLIPRCLVDAELASGALRLAWPGEHETERGYYFCTPSRTEPAPAVAALRDWLVAEASPRRGGAAVSPAPELARSLSPVR